jgi:hypothetical protein
VGEIGKVLQGEPKVGIKERSATGFRKGKSTVDQIHSLRQILEKN